MEGKDSIVVAQSAGFCVGVRKAVEQAVAAAELAKEKGLACYSLGELIHNPSVVQHLAEIGIRPVSTPQEAQGGMLLIRSHGVSRHVMRQCEEAAAMVVDCTCSFVARMHSLADSFSADGASVILVGDAQHPEIQGTAGWCNSACHVVSTQEDIACLPDGLENALVMCQTTFPPAQWAELSALLVQRYPGISVRGTICHATEERQREAADIAARVDAMVVVGGKASANTRKLYETCSALCEHTYLVECAAELPPHLMGSKQLCIGVTAGASTPAWSLKEVIDSMNDIEKNNPVQPEQLDHLTADQASAPAQEPATEAVAETVKEIVETVETTAVEAETTPESAREDVAESMPESEADDVPADSDPQAEQPAGDSSRQSREPAADVQQSFMDHVAANMARIYNGMTVVGRIVQITEDEVCVNIGYKSDGLMKRSELVDKEAGLGDEIEVEVIKVNDGEGNVILSQRNIVNRKLWEELVRKYEAGEFVEGVGKEAVKGGLLASINGVRAFIPASHLSQRYVEKISQFVGQNLRLKIIEVDQAKKRLVASRKEVLIAESEKRKRAVWDSLVKGSVVKGIVRRFASFGAFVDLGGVDGLIHISDLSWSRSAAPSDILKVNQEIDVKILSLDRERERIQLGYKQLQPHPWDNVEEKYPVGSVITRRVVRIRPFGAFIELEPGVDGLVHISQVAPHRINKVEDVLTPGQDVNVKILSVDPDARRISLSIREALEDAAFDYSMDIPGGDTFTEPAEDTSSYAQSDVELVYADPYEAPQIELSPEAAPADEEPAQEQAEAAAPEASSEPQDDQPAEAAEAAETNETDKTDETDE